MKLTEVVGIAVCAVVFCGGRAFAQEQEKTLMREQWGRKVGESAQDLEVLKATLRQISPDERPDFAQKTLRAITRMPLGPQAKSERYVGSAILCLSQVREDNAYSVVAHAVALALVPHLPALVEEMSKRLDLKDNKGVTEEQYRAIAAKGVQVCFARNAYVEDTTLRNTFAILLFMRAAPDLPGLQDTLLAQLPDDASRKLAAEWLAKASDGEYDEILAAADAAAKPPAPAINLVGYPETQRLLPVFLASDSFLSALALAGGTGASITSIDIQVDTGINETPLMRRKDEEPIKPYQNQRIRF